MNASASTAVLSTATDEVDTDDAMSLCDLPCHARAVVASMRSPRDENERALVLRLIEIGFLPGEEIRVVAHGHPGREPIAVRLGHTTFALRRFEADFVRVQPAR